MLKRFRESTTDERAQKLNRSGDAIVLGVAASGAALSYGAPRWEVAVALFAGGSVLWYLASRALHQYDAGNGRGFLGDLALTLVIITSVIAPAWMVALAFPRYLSPTCAARFAGVLLAATLLLRLRLVGLRLWRSRPIVGVLIIGTGPLGRLTGAEISDGETHRRLLGYLRFDDEAPCRRLEAPLFGAVSHLEATLRERVVDEVYLASTANEHHADVQAAIQTCERFGVPFALPACGYRLTRARPAAIDAAFDGYAHFTAVHVTPLTQSMKRLFDILISATALVLLSPALVATAALVRLTSRGPVLFRQKRVGLFGREFDMLKFRSMVVNAEELKAELLIKNDQTGPVFKMKHDPRVTAVGRFLRRYSVDELPQLLNVLRGDMSIVGPRPPLPSEVAQYEAWQHRRLSVRPGLTCVWQVSGRNDISFQDWMLLDMRYIDHWSFVRDLVLVLKTVPVVLTGRGAS